LWSVRDESGPAAGWNLHRTNTPAACWFWLIRDASRLATFTCFQPDHTACPASPPCLSDAAASMERCVGATHIAARSSLICPPSWSRSRLFDGFLACRQPLRRRLNG